MLVVKFIGDNMKQILKRLELIKTSISIEDEEIITLQVEKLKTLEVDSEVLEILALIDSSDYTKVTEAIDAMLSKYSGLVLYEDKELLGLKLALKSLEKKLQEASDKKREYLNTIDSFHAEYHLHLGDIIQQILSINQERLYDAVQDDETLEEEYFQAKQEYEKFHQEYEVLKEEERFELDEEELKELKHSYRKASRLSHPDIVEDAFKEQAEEVFKELNEAYSKKDLQRVKSILQGLESGEGFEVGSESIHDKELLKQKIEKLRETLAQTEREIEEIMADETFELIKGLDDWDMYFQELKEELEEELERLSQQENQKTFFAAT
jgi:hypothetical protein